MENIAVLLLITLRKTSSFTDEEEVQYVGRIEQLGTVHKADLVKRFATAWQQNNNKVIKSIKKETEIHEESLLDSPMYSVYEQAVMNVTDSVSEPVDKNGNTLLHLATMDNQMVLLYAYGLLGMVPNAQNKDGDSPLHLAAGLGRLHLAEALLQIGVNPMLKNKMGLLAIDIAVRRNDVGMTDLLFRSSPGLIQGILNNNLRDVMKAIQRWTSPLGVPVDIVNKLSQDDPIYKAVRAAADNVILVHRIMANDTRGARRMLHQPSDSNIRLNINLRHLDSGMTPLAAAVKNHNSVIVSDLLCHGANCLYRIHNEPLITLALKWQCPVDIVVNILDHDSRTWHVRDHAGRTVFLCAVEDDRRVEDVLRILRASNGLCLAQRNAKGETALDWCRRYGHDKLLKALQEEVRKLFTNVSQQNKLILMKLAVAFFGATNFTLPVSPGVAYEKFMKRLSDIENRGSALMFAAASGDLESVKRLNDAAFVDQNGYTALIRAIMHDQFHVVQWLIVERPVLKSIADLEGRSVLHYAYALPENIGAKYVHLMLEQDSEGLEEMGDKDGIIPCQYATMRGTPKLEEMLRRAFVMDTSGRMAGIHREKTIM